MGGRGRGGADIDAVCRVFDVTVNDVALAAIIAGCRAVLLNRGAEPDHSSLRTLVPISVRDSRDPKSLDTPGTRVSLMLPLLPVDGGGLGKRRSRRHVRFDLRCAERICRADSRGDVAARRTCGRGAPTTWHRRWERLHTGRDDNTERLRMLRFHVSGQPEQRSFGPGGGDQ